MVKFPKTVDPSSPEFEFYNSLIGTPILQGILSERITFPSSGTVFIKHQLGRVYRGFICTYRDANANFYIDTTNTRPGSELWLVNSLASPVTGQFWIF